MTAGDLPVLLAVADSVHPNYPEDPSVFAERLALHPQGCLVLERGGEILGYIVSHPWVFAQPPTLDSLLGGLPADPTTFYIHDIALLPAARGSGAGRDVVALLVRQARALGLSNLSLVAVNDSTDFWQGLGFREHDDPALAAKLMSYDAKARYMVRQIRT
jgi:ribosomal protein S18 acetylase RimI-like enzyme